MCHEFATSTVDPEPGVPLVAGPQNAARPGRFVFALVVAGHAFPPESARTGPSAGRVPISAREMAFWKQLETAITR